MAREADRDRHARSVFVGNIPFEATETELREIFEQAGPIVSFRIVHDRETGKPKGFGFIEYQDAAIAASCCRNLNNVEYNGRPLRVGPASTDGGAAVNSEIKALQQALGNAVQESPYGAAVEPDEAPEAISKAVSSLPPEQMFELMKQMKICIQNNPNEARNMLLQNPQLAYALLQAQIVMKIVDPAVAMALLHRERETQPPVRNEAPPPEPIRPPVAPNPLISPTAGRPSASGGLLGDGPPKPAPSADPRLQQAPPQSQTWQDNRDRPGAPPNMSGPPTDTWSGPPKPPGFDRDQRGGPPPRGGDFDRGSQGWDRRESRDRNENRGRPDPRERDPRDRGDPRERGGSREMRGDPRERGDPRDRADPRDRGDPRDRRAPPSHGAGYNERERERDRSGPSNRHAPPARSEPPPRNEQPPSLMNRNAPPATQQFPPRASPAQAAPPSIPAALAGADSEKAALIMQVLQLTDEQIQQLPPEQRQSIILLKQQLQQR